MPEDKFVVLGLVSTKNPRLEGVDELINRVGEASRHIAKERLGLSPQCGFASSIIGNRIAPDDQRRKLELVVNTARMLWP